MKRFHLILLGTVVIIMAFSAIIYIRVLDAPYAASYIAILWWQALVWSPWLIFGQFINILDHRFPIVEQPVIHWILRHISACVLLMVVHGGWFFVISSNFSPFLGADNTRYGAFLFFFIMWAMCDFLFYWVLLGIFALRQLLSISPVDNNDKSVQADYLLLKTTGRQSSVATQDILWIEAEDYCCRVHTNSNNYLVRQSLNSFEISLPKDKFLRIHRSTIVNIKQVELIEKVENRKHVIRLRNGIERAISKSGRQKLHEALDN